MLVYDNNMDLKNIIKDADILVMNIGVETCPSCPSIKDRIGTFARDNNVDYVYVDAKVGGDVCWWYGVTIVPSVLLFVGGELILKKSGDIILDDIFSEVDTAICSIRK